MLRLTTEILLIKLVKYFINFWKHNVSLLHFPVDFILTYFDNLAFNIPYFDVDFG